VLNEKTWTVYIHRNKINGKVYIGITCQKVNRRWGGGKNYNGSIHFFNAIKKYGWNGFEHEIVLTGLTEQQAANKERELIAKYNSMDDIFGYNLTSGGEIGKKYTDEVRKKLSESRKGTVASKETKEKISKASKGTSNGNYGNHLSQEAKEKISLFNKNYYKNNKHPMLGTHHSKETILKLVNSHKGLLAKEKHPSWGKHLSKETKNKISQSHRVENLSEESRKNISNAQKGKKASEKTKRKMSVAHSGAKHYRARKVICINTKEVFDTIASAVCKYGARRVGSCCRNQRKSAGKHPETREPLKWMFYDDYLKQNNVRKSA